MQSVRSTPQPGSIQCLSENTRGCDHLIGDLHGSLSEFKMALDSLGDNDRLFLVGDLFDRGENSIGVFDEIMERNKNGQKVFVARGNHEGMFLKAFDVLEKINSDKKIYRTEALYLVNFLQNGGDWVAGKNAQQIQDQFYDDNWDLKSILRLIKGSDPGIQKLRKIADYIRALPYVLRVGDGDKAFVVCHAHLPLSDDDLDQKIQRGEGLGQDEIQVITWGRRENILETLQNRDSDSRIVYCGHSAQLFPPVVDEVDEESVKFETQRKYANFVNLDGGTCHSHQLIMVNHHQCTAEVISGISRNDGHLQNLCDKIKQTLLINKCGNYKSLRTELIRHFEQYRNPLETWFGFTSLPSFFKQISRTFNDCTTERMEDNLLGELSKIADNANNPGKAFIVLRHQMEFSGGGDLGSGLASVNDKLCKLYPHHYRVYRFIHGHFKAYLEQGNGFFNLKSFTRKDIVKLEEIVMDNVNNVILSSSNLSANDFKSALFKAILESLNNISLDENFKERLKRKDPGFMFKQFEAMKRKVNAELSALDRDHLFSQTGSATSVVKSSPSLSK